MIKLKEEIIYRSSADKLSFRMSKPQKYFCSWNNKERIMRYKGHCECCFIRTYGFDDGYDDPRGPLGDHANTNLRAEEYNKKGRDIVACFGCSNDYFRYQVLMRKAERAWTE